MKRLNSQLQEDGAPMELILLLRTLLAGCKEISFRVSQGALAGVLGSTLSENVQGETQKKLDVISNQILKDILSESGYVKAISSEEEDEVVPCNPNGNYLVSFDPLDGSSNTDINSLIGTIFSITHAPQWMARIASTNRDHLLTLSNAPTGAWVCRICTRVLHFRF